MRPTPRPPARSRPGRMSEPTSPSAPNGTLVAPDFERDAFRTCHVNGVALGNVQLELRLGRTDPVRRHQRHRERQSAPAERICGGLAADAFGERSRAASPVPIRTARPSTSPKSRLPPSAARISCRTSTAAPMRKPTSRAFRSSMPAAPSRRRRWKAPTPTSPTSSPSSSSRSRPIRRMRASSPPANQMLQVVINMVQ